MRKPPVPLTEATDAAVASRRSVAWHKLASARIQLMNHERWHIPKADAEAKVARWEPLFAEIDAEHRRRRAARSWTCRCCGHVFPNGRPLPSPGGTET